jgi:hypothetical protein
MVIANTDTKERAIDWRHFEERTQGFSKMREIVTGQVKDMDGFTINPGESFVFELMQ